ncbi:MAG TPA: PCP reductase family protein [Longimicrobiales bacterium]
MKFLCLACDEVMHFAERQLPGDGTLAAVFGCPACGHEVAMLANPMETQFVSSLGIKIGGREVPAQPLELVRSQLAEGRPDAFTDRAAEGAADDDGAGTARTGTEDDGAAARGPEAGGASPPRAGTAPRVVWSDAAVRRLENVPSFVRGMVKRIYTDYARDHGIAEITPAVMDRARTELGLEGM